MPDNRIAIPGSAITRSPGVERMRTADPNQLIDATIVIRRPPSAGSAGTTRAEIEKQLSAGPADLEAVTDFARQHGLQILEASPAKRTVHVRGSIQQMNAAFGIDLAHYSAPNSAGFLSYDGPLTVAAPAASAILAVLGLHQQPVARPRCN